MILLHRIDPAVNMRRYYRVQITADLFGEFGLQRVWGRIGRAGQAKCEWFGAHTDARKAQRRLVRAKLRKGYSLVRLSGRSGQAPL